MDPLVKLRSDCWLTIPANNALKKAIKETGKYRKDIIAEAIEDWLVNCGYLGEEYFDKKNQ